MLSHNAKNILYNVDNLFSKKPESKMKGMEKDTKIVFATAADMKCSKTYEKWWFSLITNFTAVALCASVVVVVVVLRRAR